MNDSKVKLVGKLRFNSRPITYARHRIDGKDIKQVKRVLRSDWLTIGPLVQEFENAISAKVGTESVVVSSGTAALHCAYYSIGLKQGDEVITPAITFAATQATAKIFGAKIKFADIDYETGNISIESVKKLISPNTKAIVAVDFAGQPGDLATLRKIADENKVFLIEDAAHSFGSIC